MARLSSYKGSYIDMEIGYRRQLQHTIQLGPCQSVAVCWLLVLVLEGGPELALRPMWVVGKQAEQRPAQLQPAQLQARVGLLVAIGSLRWQGLQRVAIAPGAQFRLATVAAAADVVVAGRGPAVVGAAFEMLNVVDCLR